MCWNTQTVEQYWAETLILYGTRFSKARKKVGKNGRFAPFCQYVVDYDAGDRRISSFLQHKNEGVKKSLRVMALLKNKSTPTVYSTEHGRACPECSRPVADCLCARQKPVCPGDGIVRVGRETKGRKGKGVTVISGVPLDQSGLMGLAKDLKKRCGSGGTVKDGAIEIQGDHRDLLIVELQKRGWRVKRAGG